MEEHLAACANILPAVESIYHWKGKLEESTETVVFFKTNVDSYYRLERRLKELHSHETPEIIAIPVQAGLLEYLRWVDDSCR